MVFHSLLVHAGIPNVSDRIRVSVDFRYQPASEPLAALSTGPHYFEKGFDLPPWERFSQGWSTQQWREVPVTATVLDDALPLVTGRIGPHAGTREGRSRFFDSTVFADQVVEQPVLVSVASAS